MKRRAKNAGLDPTARSFYCHCRKYFIFRFLQDLDFHRQQEKGREYEGTLKGQLTEAYLKQKLCYYGADLSFGTPRFRGHKIWFRKNIHIIFLSVTSIEGIPLFRGNGRLFLGAET